MNEYVFFVDDGQGGRDKIRVRAASPNDANRFMLSRFGTGRGVSFAGNATAADSNLPIITDTGAVATGDVPTETQAQQSVGVDPDQGGVQQGGPTGTLPPTDPLFGEAQPRAAAIRGLERRQGGAISPRTLGDFLRLEQVNPLINAFDLGSLAQGFGSENLGIPGVQTRGAEATSSALEDFVAQIGSQGVRQSAGETIASLMRQNLAAQDPSSQAIVDAQGIPVAPGFTALTDFLQNPTDVGQAIGLADLGRTALAGRVSPRALQFLRLPSGQQLFDRFQAATGGEGGGNFLQDLFSQLGLSRAGIGA